MTTQPTFLSRLPAVLLTAVCALPCARVSYAQTAARHPVVGSWSWTVFSGKCTETLQYGADGVLLSTSGDAVTAWRYQAGAATDAQGFYQLLETSLRSNGKKDCNGDVVDDDDTTATRFIQLSPAKDRLIVCKTASLLACYGPLKREQH